MRFGERVMFLVCRPIYRTFVERPLWWFLAKVKVFFMSDITAQIHNVDGRLQHGNEQHLIALEDRLRALEANNAAQWDAMEHLLLALLRQPELPASASEESRALSAINLN